MQTQDSGEYVWTSNNIPRGSQPRFFPKAGYIFGYENMDEFMALYGNRGGSGGFGALNPFLGRLENFSEALAYYNKLYEELAPGTPLPKRTPIDTNWNNFWRDTWHERARYGDTIPVYNDPFRKP